MAQEFLKSEIWAPQLERLGTAVGNWGIATMWARRGIT